MTIEERISYIQTRLDVLTQASLGLVNCDVDNYDYDCDTAFRVLRQALCSAQVAVESARLKYRLTVASKLLVIL